MARCVNGSLGVEEGRPIILWRPHQLCFASTCVTEDDFETAVLYDATGRLIECGSRFPRLQRRWLQGTEVTRRFWKQALTSSLILGGAFAAIEKFAVIKQFVVSLAPEQPAITSDMSDEEVTTFLSLAA